LISRKGLADAFGSFGRPSRPIGWSRTGSGSPSTARTSRTWGLSTRSGGEGGVGGGGPRGLRDRLASPAPVVPIAARSGKSEARSPSTRDRVSMERMNRILEIRPPTSPPRGARGDHRRVPGRGGEARALLPARSQLARPLHHRWKRRRERRRPRALRYGVTREYVLGLEVVIPTGEVLRVGGRPSRRGRLRPHGALRGERGNAGHRHGGDAEAPAAPRHVATALVCFRTSPRPRRR